MGTVKTLPPVQRLRELFDYSPETGELVWKVGRKAGRRAGTVHVLRSGYKYLRVKVDERRLFVHRVVWKMQTGEEPPAEIDHKSRDATDNRWSNLRDGTAVNPKNLSVARNNTSGFTGVCWRESRRKWRAIVGRREIGSFSELDEAIMAAMEEREMEGFDPSHGRKHFLSPFHQLNAGVQL